MILLSVFTVTLVVGFAVITKGDVCHAANGLSCSISGNWTNELGSYMMLECNPTGTNAGTLTGRYNTAVGQAADFYELSGRYTLVGDDYILGFSVAWNNVKFGNSHSTTSWTGVYYQSQKTITTLWILTRYTDPKDMWGNSQIGKNVFVPKS